MKRLAHLLLSVPLVLAGLVVTATVPLAPAATAGCAPPAGDAIWKITNVTKSFKPTGLYSNWVQAKYDKMHITYAKTATSTWSATVTGTISAEAGVIFAKASTSISVAVGKQWSKTDTWSYTADIPKDPDHEYRLVQKQETRHFRATKFYWSQASCTYGNKSKTGFGEMPLKTEQSLVWKVERRNA
ncbi:hypothetical protein [Nocardioides rubriscoriae]|uniref:hypothetical protein n=1 Tax=Nocardioides rubriscoriae TaxID=642762 RepID=UPI0011E03478|nr:hypothetical protein [Nocardioides rubriscoriae]